MSTESKVIIDTLTIRLPKGWQGDSVYLSRKIAEQIQTQAAELHSQSSLSLVLHTHLGTDSNSVAAQVGKQLSSHYQGLESAPRSASKSVSTRPKGGTDR